MEKFYLVKRKKKGKGTPRSVNEKRSKFLCVKNLSRHFEVVGFAYSMYGHSTVAIFRALR